MKSQLQYFNLLLFAMTAFLITGCTNDWLEEKRDIKLVVPTTLKDMRSLLNNYDVLGIDNIGATLVSADDHYLTKEVYGRGSSFARNLYTWGNDPFEGLVDVPDWNDSYQQIFYANNILEGLEKIKPNEYDQEEWNDIKGGALFYRAKANFNLAQMFAMPFGKGISESILGIPLKLSADINAKTQRASLVETYNQIVEDLKASASLLKIKPLRKTDASKPAAYAILARVYLTMHDYEEALKYADSCLRVHSQLLDYNDIDSGKTYPFTPMSEEVIFQSKLYPQYLGYSNLKIDSTLYLSFSEKDLRKKLFFQKDNSGLYNFKGTYHGDFNMFSGIATDEIFLIKVECLTRLGSLVEANRALNELLTTRYEKDAFVPYKIDDQKELLDLILLERRKQLMFRGLRWSDLRRLNQEKGTETILRRNLGNETYELLPNENRYTLTIPDNIIEHTGIEQNKR